MLPRLTAEETLAASTAVALGSGMYKKGDPRRIRAALERRAAIRPRAAKVDYALLAAMGIGVEVEE